MKIFNKYLRNRTVQMLEKKVAGLDIESKKLIDEFLLKYENIPLMWDEFLQSKKSDEIYREESIEIDKKDEELGSYEEVYNHQINNGQVDLAFKISTDLSPDYLSKCKILPQTVFEDLLIDSNNKVITAIPKEEGDHEIILECNVKQQHRFRFYINEDPQKLWKNIASSQEVKNDNDSSFIENEQTKILYASRRGRSHANVGSPRDDDSRIDYYNGWSITVVADGAGAAKNSALGSKVVCEKVLSEVKSKLDQIDESLFCKKDDSKSKLQKLLYTILASPAHNALISLIDKAKELKIDLKSLHTTLLLTISKKIDGRHFVAGFQVGDGIIVTLSEDEVSLLSEPDSGVYKGETVFLTSQSVFTSSNNLKNRIKFGWFDKLKAIISLTDGITDPFFDDDIKALKEKSRWDNLWNKEIEPCIIEKNPDQALLEWLNFYKEGQHDDRTISLIIPKS